MRHLDNPVANPMVVLREEFDDWAILFNPDTADVVCINPVGVVIWKLMDGEHTLENMVAKITERFSEVPDAVGKEVNTFIDKLAENGFVGYELEGFKQ